MVVFCVLVLVAGIVLAGFVPLFEFVIGLCLVSITGFAEALWIKRKKPTILVDAQPMYLAKLVWHRMPLFDILTPRAIAFQLRQPHTLERCLKYLGPLSFEQSKRPAAVPLAARVDDTLSLREKVG